MIVEGFAVVPTVRQRQADLKQSASYSLYRMPGLRRPLASSIQRPLIGKARDTGISAWSVDRIDCGPITGTIDA